MTVKWLLYWQPGAGGQVSSQTLLDIMKCLDSINATRVARWTCVTAQYRPIVRDPSIPIDSTKDILGVAFSDNPGKHFFILRADHLVLEADSNIQEIMEKLQTHRNRLTLLFEGFQYQYGDFNIKTGRAILNNESFRGIVMEVEYLPVSSWEKSKLLFQEFVDLWHDVISKHSLNGRFVASEVMFGDYSLSDHYSWQHTALQYISVMVQFMGRT